MTRIVLCGIKTKLNWKMKYEVKDSERGPQQNWSAWPSDTQVEESGAPVLKAFSIERLIEKIELFEQGTMYESDIDK